MTNTSVKNRIHKKRFYPYPVSAVWHALTDKEALNEWLMPVHDFELKEGKKFHFKTKPSIGFDGMVYCEVLSVRENKFLQYSWKGGNMQQPTVVSWKLRETEKGTQVELEHSGFIGASGWFTKQILNFGWTTLTKKKLWNYLSTHHSKLA